jgi:hypothetical protein
MRVFIVKRWIRSDSFEHLYFVGDDVPPSAKAKVAADGSTSAADLRVILRSVKSDVPVLAPFRVVFDQIFWDDKAVAAVTKIARNLGSKVEDVYAWVDTVMDDRMEFANHLARDLMRGSLNITGLQIVDMLSRIISHDMTFPEQINYERITHHDTYNILVESTMYSYLRRIMFDYTINSYRHIFMVNPIQADATDLTEVPKVFENVADITLYEYRPTDNIIHVLARDDFISMDNVRANPGLLDLYFPPEVSTSSLYVETGNDKLYARLVENADAYKERHFLKKLFLKVEPIGPTVAVNLRYVFERFELDSTCPLSRYGTRAQVVYKADLSALTSVAPTFLARMTDDGPPGNMRVRSGESTLKFKIVYGDYFATLELFSTLRYNVKFTFQTLQTDDVAYVSDMIMPYVNHCLAKIRDICALEIALYDVVVPPLTIDMINRHHVLDMQTIATHTFANRLPPIKRIEDRMAALGGVFFRVPNQFGADGRNVVTYKYNRASGYNTDIDVQIFMWANLNKANRRDLIDAVLRRFLVPRAKAESTYDNIDAKREHRPFLKSFKGLTVKVTRVNDYEVVTNVRGEKLDMVVATHIDALIKALLTIQDSVVLEAKLQEIADFEMAQVGADDGFDPGAAGDDALLDGLDGEVVAVDAEDSGGDEEDEDGASAASTGAFSLKKYILSRLKSADKDLFAFESQGEYKSYASLCASNNKRQPIVVTTDQLAKLRTKYPGSIPNFVHAGSTDDKRQKNVYICPKIWCTRSEVAMTPAQFKAAGGCPSKDDHALHLYRPGDEGRSKFASFLEPSRHPKEQCVPCCFFVDHEKKFTGKLRRRFAQCRGDPNADKINGGDDDTYIKGLVFPLDAGRYGRLAYTLAKYLGTPDCHERARAGGCFVRKGIAHGSQYFLSALAAVLDIVGVTTGAELVDFVAERMPVREFVKLNNGAALRMFADDTLDFSDPEFFDEFRAWFLLEPNSGYVNDFALQDLAAALGAAKRNGRTLEPELHAEAQREFLVYVAMANFFNYLRSDVTKDHAMLLGMVRPDAKWVNPHGVRIVVLDDDASGKVFVLAPRLAQNEGATTGAPTVMIAKHDGFYEPIVRVSGTGEDVMRFVGDVERVTALTHFYDSAVRALAIPGPSASVDSVKLWVVDPTYRCVGVFDATGGFVPFSSPVPLPAQGRCVHAHRVASYIIPQPVPAALSRLRALSKTDGFYEKATEHPNGIGVLMGDDATYVPVANGDHSQWMRDLVADLEIFGGIQVGDEAYNFVEQWNARQAAYQGFRRATVLRMLGDNQMRQEFEFLRSDVNPLPVEMKTMYMRRLVKKASPGPTTLPPEEMDKALHAMVGLNLVLLTSMDARDPPNVVYLTQAQVEAGELKSMLSKMDRYIKYTGVVVDAVDAPSSDVIAPT